MADGGVASDLRVASRACAPARADAGRAGLASARAADGFPPEFVALAGAGVAVGDLLAALAEAERIGAEPFDVLMTSGGFDETGLVAALARGLGVAAFDERDLEGAAIDAETCANAFRTGILRIVEPGGRARLLVAARGPSVGRLAAARRGRPAGGAPVVLAGPRLFADALVARADPALAARAALGPGAIAPELTVAGAMPEIGLAVRVAAVGLAAVATLAVFAVPGVAAGLACMAGAAFFVLNLFRIWLAGTSDTDDRNPAPIHDRSLPVYTVMVGLMREGAVVAGLLDALERLDYPAAKLDIKLLLEAGDDETLDALARRPPRAGVEVLVLPPGGPKTKPRALNAGLLAARGTFLTVFDAEDRPDFDQLRRAVAAFRHGPAKLACVQARLAIDNIGDGWLARQFAIEYAALFDVGLPALSTRGLPIPLGGTSNHFRTAALRTIGGWDAGNVTEDADLGLRIARLGWATRTIRSTTWEEATTSLWPWLKQRTRWMKGYMVTAIVHGRSMRDLARRLGPLRFAAAQLAIGGVALTALAYPVVLVAAVVAAWRGAFWVVPGGMVEAAFVGVHAANIFFGYAMGIACGWCGVDRRGPPGLARDLVFMPVYWFLVGVAAWRALWQLLFQSATHWEKTAHGVSTRRPPPPQR